MMRDVFTGFTSQNHGWICYAFPWPSHCTQQHKDTERSWVFALPLFYAPSPALNSRHIFLSLDLQSTVPRVEDQRIQSYLESGDCLVLLLDFTHSYLSMKQSSQNPPSFQSEHLSSKTCAPGLRLSIPAEWTRCPKGTQKEGKRKGADDLQPDKELRRVGKLPSARSTSKLWRS